MRGIVNSLSFSPDGTRIASASWDKSIKLWDVQTGEELSTLNGHTGSVRDVSFSPDGTRIASVSGSWHPNIDIENMRVEPAEVRVVGRTNRRGTQESQWAYQCDK